MQEAEDFYGVFSYGIQTPPLIQATAMLLQWGLAQMLKEAASNPLF